EYLLVAECGYRVQPAGPVCRVEAEEDADAGAYAHCEARGAQVQDKSETEDVGNSGADAEAGAHSQNPADCCEDSSVNEKLPEYDALSRAERFADADVAGAFDDSDEHYVHYAYASDEQRNCGNS